MRPPRLLRRLRMPGQPLPARGSPPAPHVPPNTRPVVTSRLSPSAAGDGVAGAAARFTPRLLGASIPHISLDRGAPLERAGARQRPRWWRALCLCPGMTIQGKGEGSWNFPQKKRPIIHECIATKPSVFIIVGQRSEIRSASFCGFLICFYRL